MAGISKALVQRSFKEPMKQLALRKNLGHRLTQVFWWIEFSRWCLQDIVQSHYRSHSGLPVRSNSFMLKSATWQQTFASEKNCWWCSPTLHSLRKLLTWYSWFFASVKQNYSYKNLWLAAKKVWGMWWDTCLALYTSTRNLLLVMY